MGLGRGTRWVFPVSIILAMALTCSAASAGLSELNSHDRTIIYQSWMLEELVYTAALAVALSGRRSPRAQWTSLASGIAFVASACSLLATGMWAGFGWGTHNSTLVAALRVYWIASIWLALVALWEARNGPLFFFAGMIAPALIVSVFATVVTVVGR